MTDNSVTMKRVAQVGVAVVTLGVAVYWVHRGNARYQTDLKAYEVARKLITPEEAAAFKHYFLVTRLRQGYIAANIEVGLGYGGLSVSLGMPFPEYWAMVESKPALMAALKESAEAVGESLEQAREHILTGAYEQVKLPLPALPNKSGYMQEPHLFALITLSLGCLAEVAMWVSRSSSET